jgi:HSP20 family protein
LFDDFWTRETGFQQIGADLYEDEQNFYARMEIPGMKKDMIDLELENSVLTVSSRTSEETKDVKSAYSYQRSISVPDGVMLDAVSADYEDGILTVCMPKQEDRKPRQITVK